MSSGSGRDSVGITWPLLRLDAPQPGSAASTTATSTPASRKCSALERPVNPAPITTTSAAAAPISRDSSGPGGVTAVHSESGQRTCALSIFAPFLVDWLSVRTDQADANAAQGGRLAGLRPICFVYANEKLQGS
jgi:hypothetical protein